MNRLRHMFQWAPVVLGFLLFSGAQPASAQQIPTGCNGTGISISIFAFFADGVTPAVGVNASECETLVFKAALGYAPVPAGNCAFQQGALIIKTPDGVEHDVTPPGGIFDPLNPGGPLTVGSGVVNSLPVTYVVDPNDVVGGQVVASTSYNQSANFPKGISFTGVPPSVGFNNGGTSIPVNVSPCPDTFCAPQLCDPAATNPNFPGRKGFCVADTPPVCPGDDCNTGRCDPQTDMCVKDAVNDSVVCDSDANGNPVVDSPDDCVHPGCEAGVCVPDHVPDPDSTKCGPDLDPSDGICPGCEAGVCVQDHIPCNKCGNRGNIRLAARRTVAQAKAAGTALDSLRIALRPLSTDPIDPTGKDVTLLMSTANGVVYSATVPAGSLKLTGRYYRYTNDAAKTQGGISRLTIFRKRDRTQIYVDAWGNLSGAQSQMNSAVVIGDTQYNHDGTWLQVPVGWKLPNSSGQ